MSRRSHQTEQEFGSDSFLDVIANIVGILIILIVIVGMKVARQPPAMSETTAPAVAIDSPKPAVLPDPSEYIGKQQQQRQLLSERSEQLELLRRQSHEREAELEKLKSVADQSQRLRQQISGDAELTTLKIAAMKQQFVRSTKQASDVEKEKSAILEAVSLLESQLTSAEAEVSTVSQATAVATEEHEKSDRILKQVRFETLQLTEVLDGLATAEAPVDLLQHRLSPVSETVEKGELHFRVEKKRISHVPLEELLERLKAQVQARKAAVTRFTRYEGAVGPVGGYRMNYTVERDSMSPLESMQYGSGTWRISVSRWTILPDQSLEAEVVEDAVRPGSRFRQIAETAAPGSAITFWIYPDSFSSFPALREIAHGLQLRVAARPLPEGTPIVGSPGGSRSTAQ